MRVRRANECLLVLGATAAAATMVVTNARDEKKNDIFFVFFGRVPFCLPPNLAAYQAYIRGRIFINNKQNNLVKHGHMYDCPHDCESNKTQQYLNFDDDIRGLSDRHTKTSVEI